MVVAITASEARRGLFPLIEKVNDDRAAYLFRSPANARRLLDAAKAAEHGETVEHSLDRA
jgi:antitoxin YefM